MDGQKGHQTSMKDEQLQEQYEDALFALLMDELAKRQGAEYSRENEALKQDAAFAVPERTYQRCLRVIRRGFAGRRFKKAGKIALLAIRKLSVAVFTLLVLFGAAIAASPRLQSSTLRFLMYFDAKGTTIEARPEENAAYASASEFRSDRYIVQLCFISYDPHIRIAGCLSVQLCHCDKSSFVFYYIARYLLCTPWMREGRPFNSCYRRYIIQSCRSYRECAHNCPAFLIFSLRVPSFSLCSASESLIYTGIISL